MAFMISWTIAPCRYREAMERFLRGGAAGVDGVTTVDRWHLPSSSRGWRVLVGPDPVRALGA